MIYERNKKYNREENNPEKYSRDECIDRAKSSGNYGVRTDAYAEGDGYLGVDDLDRIRKRRLR